VASGWKKHGRGGGGGRAGKRRSINKKGRQSTFLSLLAMPHIRRAQLLQRQTIDHDQAESGGPQSWRRRPTGSSAVAGTVLAVPSGWADALLGDATDAPCEIAVVP